MSLIECGGVECVNKRVLVYEFQVSRPVNCDQFNNNLELSINLYCTFSHS